ncbi:aldo/keto reductase [Pedobacter steynii]|nr:aldo/keto reductase [Pedobacter steynii]
MVQFPQVIFGTSSLGNLYQSIDYDTKRDIIKECIAHSPGNALFDTAGKYGAGLALEILGKALSELQVDPDEVVICNKLGWYQTELLGPEPTFEKGIWKQLKNDAIQTISYDGILKCFDQGNALLGKYKAKMVSVHDPDEYLEMAGAGLEYEKRYGDILEAYRALRDLKSQGLVSSIGIGAKNWRVIERITQDVSLDWVMIANSLTLKLHPADLIQFVSELKMKGVLVINSAVFNGGFLTGSDFYNYRKVERDNEADQALYEWRAKFFKLCDRFGVKPAEACVYFSFNVRGIDSLALNTTRPEKIKENITMVNHKIPAEFWNAMKEEELITISPAT